jgi:hypothetical protein
MAYIIALTPIFQDLFQLKTLYRAPVSPRLVNFASEACKELVARTQLRFEVEKYVEAANIIDRARRDGAIGQIVTAEMFKLKYAIGMFDISGRGNEP